MYREFPELNGRSRSPNSLPGLLISGLCTLAIITGLAAAPAVAADSALSAKGEVAASSLGHFSFTKLTVQDLDASVAFFQAVCGMRIKYRTTATINDRKAEEVVLDGAGEGEPTLVLWKWLDRKFEPNGEVVLGFLTPDIEAFVDRTKAAGGKVILPIQHNPDQGFSVAIVADPEGHEIEVIQSVSRPKAH